MGATLDTPLQSARPKRNGPTDIVPFTDHATAVLAALGHRLRLELWRLLMPYGPNGLSAGCIAEQLNVVPSLLLLHLQQMMLAGILIRRHSGNQILYAVNAEIVEQVCSFVAQKEVALPVVWVEPDLPEPAAD